MIDAARLAQANEILASYSTDCELVARRNGIYFAWANYRGESSLKRWIPRSRGSDYPSISVPFGGTCTVATMELTRWARGIPVRPIGMWEYFCSKPVGMKPLALELAIKNGWPRQVPCVFCGRLLGIGTRYDHYDLKGHDVGPGCWYGEGCGGKPLTKTELLRGPV